MVVHDRNRVVEDPRGAVCPHWERKPGGRVGACLSLPSRWQRPQSTLEPQIMPVESSVQERRVSAIATTLPQQAQSNRRAPANSPDPNYPQQITLMNFWNPVGSGSGGLGRGVLVCGCWLICGWGCAEFLGRFCVLVWNWACVDPLGVGMPGGPPAPVPMAAGSAPGAFGRSRGLSSRLIGDGGGGCAAFKRLTVRFCCWWGEELCMWRLPWRSI